VRFADRIRILEEFELELERVISRKYAVVAQATGSVRSALEAHWPGDRVGAILVPQSSGLVEELDEQATARWREHHRVGHHRTNADGSNRCAAKGQRGGVRLVRSLALARRRPARIERALELFRFGNGNGGAGRVGVLEQRNAGRVRRYRRTLPRERELDGDTVDGLPDLVDESNVEERVGRFRSAGRKRRELELDGFEVVTKRIRRPKLRDKPPSRELPGNSANKVLREERRLPQPLAADIESRRSVQMSQ
jgi:hypothetical protein